MDSESKKGKRCLVNKENKYREYYRKKNENVCWRCTIKSCKARVETENGTVVKDFGLHTHVDKVANLSTVALRVLLVNGKRPKTCHIARLSSTVQSGIVP